MASSSTRDDNEEESSSYFGAQAARSRKGGHKGKHGKQASAVLSMPSLFRATELSYQSAVSKFATYKVEEKEADADEHDPAGDEMLMKSIKNEKCIALTLKFILDQLQTLEHSNLPRIHYQTYSENYSYIVFEKPSSKLVPISSVFDSIKHNEPLCKSIMYELCRTMQFTHAFGVVHRDLRPNNVFVHIEEGELRKVMLIDFGATKALQNDEKLHLMEGNGNVTAFVRREWGQYPAPEILMDLRFDRQVDAWFLGILCYMILNGGAVPFLGDDDQEMQHNVLHSSDNKFSVLRHQITRHHQGDKSQSPEQAQAVQQWLELSDDLFDIMHGLLTKDSKKRYTIDYVLWSEWIPKLKLEFVHKAILRHWLREYRLARFDSEDVVISCISNFCAVANNIKQSAHSGSVHWHNNDKSVMHQFKLCNYHNGADAYIKSDCYVTLSSNVWCKANGKPITIEYNVDFARYDVYFGLICNTLYEKDASFYHFIGADPYSVSVSVRYGKAWLNSNDIGDLKRREYLKQNMKQETMTPAQRLFNIQNTPEDVENSDNQRNPEDRFSGPPPLRNIRVCMRIDSMSRTLSFKINNEILEPLYFEFPGDVSPAFTLCNCMDQVTVKGVYYDDMPNLQD